jgi:hypothetical protein
MIVDTFVNELTIYIQHYLWLSFVILFKILPFIELWDPVFLTVND